MSFSNELKSNNINLWNKAHVEHPFVLGMKDGSLEFKDSFSGPFGKSEKTD